jgi:hypothetical protein
MKERDEKIRRLKGNLRTARRAQAKAFLAWRIVKAMVQDDLSPTDRRQRLRAIAASKRVCLKAARTCAAIELRILSTEME